MEQAISGAVTRMEELLKTVDGLDNPRRLCKIKPKRNGKRIGRQRDPPSGVV
jgi:hypothetical protein